MSSSTADRESRRKNSFKNSCTYGRRKREDKRVLIRKKKTSDLLNKRRLLTSDKHSIRAAMIPDLYRRIFDPTQFLSATVAFRQLLSIEEKPPIDAVVETGVVVQFVSFLSHADARLQLEAAWALTNIASGTSENVRTIVRAGALKGFIHLLLSPNEAVREQCMWGIGNISGDCAAARDIVLQSGALDSVLASITRKTSISTLRIAAWVLSNFCRGKPSPEPALIAAAVPMLAQLTNSGDSAILIESLWALSYLTDADDDRIACIVSAGFLPRAVALMTHSNLSVQVPAVRLVGNVVSAHDKLTQQAIDAGAVIALRRVLDSPSKALRKESCYAISNLAAGSSEQIQHLLQLDFVPLMQELLRDGQMVVRREAAWVLSNLASGSTNAQQKKYLASCGLHKDMCTTIADEVQPAKLYKNALEGLLAMLTFCHALRADVFECGGVDRLGDLQQHSDHAVYDAAVRILEEFFDT